MKISIIGCGYVGAVTGAGFAELGHEIIFVDVDQKKIDSINSGISPIFEQGLQELILRNRGLITATSDIEDAINKTEISFICVGTPSNADGSINLSYIESAARSIGNSLKNKKNFHSVIVKSTVIPGTTENVSHNIIQKYSGKKMYVDFGIGMMPEFLKEGTAVNDFFKPDRIVIGSQDPGTKAQLNSLISQFSCPKLFTNIKTAEMIKYISNAFLATKISFANQVGNLCKSVGIDSYEVFNGVGLDSRINPDFFRCGIGFGGSCFPKDVEAIINFADQRGIDLNILKAVMSVNASQPLRIIDILKKYYPDLHGISIGVLGLAFKPDTDDIRDSRSIPIITQLVKEGANIVAYDPEAMNSFKKIFPRLNYVKTAEMALNTDVILILTEWKEFESLDYSGKIVIDGRRLLAIRKTAATYEGVCW